MPLKVNEFNMTLKHNLGTTYMIGCDRSSDDSAYGRIALIRLYIGSAQAQRLPVRVLSSSVIGLPRCILPVRKRQKSCVSPVLLYYRWLREVGGLRICRLIGGEHEMSRSQARIGRTTAYFAVVRAVGKGIRIYRAVVVGRVDFVVRCRSKKGSRLTVKSHLQSHASPPCRKLPPLLHETVTEAAAIASMNMHQLILSFLIDGVGRLEV